MRNYYIESRNYDLIRTGIIEDYLTFEAIIRFSDVSTFTLSFMANSPSVPLLDMGSGIIIKDLEGNPLMSGTILRVTRKWDETESGPGTVTVAGESDEAILWRNITWPVPHAGPEAQTADRFTGTAAAGTAIGDLIRKNIGEDANFHRAFPNLYSDPDDLGSTVTYNTRFDILGEKCREIALAGGVGFQLLQTDDERLDVVVTEPQDRSDTAIFSKYLGNLREFTYTLRAASQNALLVACQGEGKDRYLSYHTMAFQDAYNPKGVKFVDRRDIPLIRNPADGSALVPIEPEEEGDPTTRTPTQEELDAVNTAAEEAWQEMKYQAELSITPIDTPQLAYGRDYKVGDIIGVVIDDTVVTDVVREVRLSDSISDGPRVQPHIGTEDADSAPRLFKDIRRAWAAIRRLEARK